MPAPDPQDTKFQAIARASILSGIENKHTQYIAMADRRAQGLLAISAVLAPIALSRINDPQLFVPVLTFLVGASITIVCAALCLMPKRFRKITPDDRFLLHFSYISSIPRDRYLDQMADAISDTTVLAQEVSKDLYHLSRDVLIPKFRWLRIAYAAFVLGLCISLGLVVFEVLKS